MNSFNLHSLSFQITWSFTFLVMLCFPICVRSDSEWYDTFGNYFNCGNVSHVGFPFWGGSARPKQCGYPGLELSCNNNNTTTLQIKSLKYQVLDINQNTHVIKLARDDFLQGICMQEFVNTTLDFELFYYALGSQNLTILYGCPPPYSPNPGQFTCKISGTNDTDGYPVEGVIGPSGCHAGIVVPVLPSSPAQIGNWSTGQVIAHGFEAVYKIEDAELCAQCEASTGRCGFDVSEDKATCLCSDGSESDEYASCSSSNSPETTGNSSNSKKSVVIGKMALSKSKIALLGSFSALGVGALVVLVYYVRLRCFSKEEGIWQKGKQDVEAFLRDHGTIGLQRYSYSDLKNLTNSFKDKLGQGGYGVVYKGKIKSNNHLIAVKILKKAEKTANDFINEVASIGKTNHVNVVTLLGFCYEGRHQALIYDFMPNGSLEKYLYGKNNNHSLSWEELFQIAIGIAKGLEYLHRGCNTRILHFDIKPHNILLDGNLCPKISDFGLAKQCLQKESLVSLSEARGTMGYIAPEVFMRNYGGVSLKSDVYSYGMLVLDMVGCRRQAYNGDDECSNTEQYFPHYIYKQLEVGEALDADDILSSEENEIKKKMILVSLCCVKINPSSRPEMSQVVDMLEGSVESLQIPPISLVAPSSMFDGFTSSQAQSLLRSFSVTPTL